MNKSISNFLSIRLIMSILMVQALIVSSLSQVHNWETVEVTFTAQNSYANAYTDVEFWVQLSGPDFNEKVHGYWDGEQCR